jgi:hypothetical protein
MATDREREKRCHQELAVYERAFATDLHGKCSCAVRKKAVGWGGAWRERKAEFVNVESGGWRLNDFY